MTQALTVRQVLDEAVPGKLADAIRLYDLGSALRRIKATMAALSGATTFDITAIAAAKITINEGPKPVRDSGVLPPIAFLQSLRVTAGGTAGDYIFTDSSGTAIATTATYAGRAKISDDGKSISFADANTTGFVISYYMRPFCKFVGGIWVASDPDASIWDGQSEGIGA